MWEEPNPMLGMCEQCGRSLIQCWGCVSNAAAYLSLWLVVFVQAKGYHLQLCLTETIIIMVNIHQWVTQQKRIGSALLAKERNKLWHREPNAPMSSICDKGKWTCIIKLEAPITRESWLNCITLMQERRWNWCYDVRDTAHQTVRSSLQHLCWKKLLKWNYSLNQICLALRRPAMWFASFSLE